MTPSAIMIRRVLDRANELRGPYQTYGILECRLAISRSETEDDALKLLLSRPPTVKI